MARNYVSDIKKVIQWYNALQKAGLITVAKEEKNKEKSE